MESTTSASKSSVSLSHLQDLPPLPPSGDRRSLLIIYIHGFMGDETSFQAFPKHVHELTTKLLETSHIVHSKIYPRYKTRKSVDSVAKEFSEWLAPHENVNTDIVLVGHSMGGIVAADVVLLPSGNGGKDLRHKILGTIHLDVPFLGIHPSVISAGLASLFKPKAKPATPPSQASPMDSSSDMSLATLDLEDPTTDPNFNPPFANDTNLPSSLRPLWSAAGHFVSKHAGYPDSNRIRQNLSALGSAANTYVKSHVEFGGALTDHRQLWKRYQKLRALEEKGNDHRTRLVIFWTACSGNPKQDKSPSISGRSSPMVSKTELEATTSNIGTVSSIDSKESTLLSDAESEMFPSTASSTTVDSTFSIPSSINTLSTTAISIVEGNEATRPNWPPLPPTPTLPTPPDLTQYTDKSVQEAIKRQYDRNVKAYNQASKDREATIKERKKVEEKLQKTAEKESKKELKSIKSTDSSSQVIESSQSNDYLPQEKEKVVKEKHFCILPPKIASTELDEMIWTKIQMGSVDQVTAHCGMFDVQQDCYRPLVNRVADRILEWVKESKA